MVLYTDIHFQVGRNPDKKDWVYVSFSWLAWIATICFFALRSNEIVWGRSWFITLQILTPFLFLYPIYIIGKSLKVQWQEKAVYMWDVLLFLLFVAIALLVAMGQFYIRQEWLDTFFNRT